MARSGIATLLLATLCAACGRQPDYPAPPRSDSQPQFEPRDSTLEVPVTMSLDRLQASLERSTPKKLWSIDERRRKCIAGQRVKAFGAKLKVTPDIGCRIVGKVTRGTLKLSGKGRRITIRMPVNAVLTARDVGGVVKQETATGSALVYLNANLRTDRQWQPHASVDITYDWTEEPGIDFLGQRIRFARQADKELAGVVAGLERDLEREISRIDLKPQVAEAWRQGFAVIRLNREKPPAWMRITPAGIAFDGYAVEGRTLRLNASLEAKTETFVSSEPPTPPPPTDLPPQHDSRLGKGFNIFIPVVADYAQLEPVLLRALKKLAKRGIDVSDVGRVEAQFDKVTIYATQDNHIAVGVDARVRPIDNYVGIQWGDSRGQIWMTAEPYHDPDSQMIQIRNLAIFGNMDELSGDLLVRLMASDDIRNRIETSLKEDFSSDYNRVLEAARKAVGQRREGDFLITAELGEVRHGLLQATGAGLFLPVEATGTARIVHVPR